MKLATYKDGSRDGQLVVVSRDLATGHYASGIATRLQQVLELRRKKVPVVEDLLQSRRDPAGIVAGREVTRNDDELAVARAVLVGCLLYTSPSPRD